MRKLIYSMGVSLDGFIAGPTARSTGRRRTRSCIGSITGRRHEYRLFVSPVALGGGTPYFPALDEGINLELLETQTFGSRVVYLRYGRV
jgi:hypothetical protein